MSVCKICHSPFNGFGVKDRQDDFIAEWCHLSQLESKKWVIMVTGQEWDEWSDDGFYDNTYRVPTRFCPICGRDLRIKS